MFVCVRFLSVSLRMNARAALECFLCCLMKTRKIARHAERVRFREGHTTSAEGSREERAAAVRRGGRVCVCVCGAPAHREREYYVRASVMR